MKNLFLFAFIFGLVNSMTEKQIKSSLKLVRNSCQPKTKVTDESIDKMHNGVWEEDEKAKCYMNCCLNFFKLADKDGVVNLEEALKFIPQLPEPRQAPLEGALKACADSGKEGTDKCDASWRLAKCMYFFDPEHYILP